MERFIEKDSVKENEFDIIIIGGGITGAAVAYEAADRGLKVALVEKNDFGAATSSATSKLIHGGLRYLKNMEFDLVRESLRERKTLSNIAPNLVYPLPFLLPIYQNSKSGKMILGMGMLLYDMLSYDKKKTWDASKKLPNFRSVSAQEALTIAPNLKKEGLKGGYVYYDCQSIHPERLTFAFIRSAVEKGAKVANYAKVTDFVMENEKEITGVKVKDVLSQKTTTVKGKLVINCTGAWVDDILQLYKYRNGHKTLKRSEGIHIVTEKNVGDCAVGLMTPSGRHLMVMPWRGYSLIGTTDKPYEGDPDDWKVTRQSIQELLDDFNEVYGEQALTFEDVLAAYGGLRPLVDEQTEESYKASRKYEICDHATEGVEGLVSVEGGKYTTSRHLAESVLKVVSRKLGKNLGESQTENAYLSGCEIDNMESFLVSVQNNYTQFKSKTKEYVAKHYGMLGSIIFEMAIESPELAKVINPQGEIMAEVAYAIQYEMAKTLADILMRRTCIGTAGHPGIKVLIEITELAASMLGWDDVKMKQELSSIENILKVPQS